MTTNKKIEDGGSSNDAISFLNAVNLLRKTKSIPDKQEVVKNYLLQIADKKDRCDHLIAFINSEEFIHPINVMATVDLIREVNLHPNHLVYLSDRLYGDNAPSRDRFVRSCTSAEFFGLGGGSDALREEIKKPASSRIPVQPIAEESPPSKSPILLFMQAELTKARTTLRAKTKRVAAQRS